MPIFRLEDDKLIIAQETNVELEKHLEVWLENSPEQTLAQEDFLWIGRQTSAAAEESTIFSDLLGVDSEGNLVIVELKKGQTPRDVIAQLLDYAAWADELPAEQIRDIAEAYFKTREELKEKTFDDAFREAFDVPEGVELPQLNRGLRLFIAAEKISPSVARVCRFLRTSYGLDISCIDVSAFQTKSGEVLVSTETKVGDENFAAPKTQKQKYASPPSQQSGNYPSHQDVWEAVQEFTNGDTNATFTPKDIDRVVLKKGFKDGPVRCRIRGSCVNFPKRCDNKPIGPNRYHRVEIGIYRIYDPKRDKVEVTCETN